MSFEKKDGKVYRYLNAQEVTDRLAKKQKRIDSLNERIAKQEEGEFKTTLQNRLAKVTAIKEALEAVQ